MPSWIAKLVANRAAIAKRVVVVGGSVAAALGALAHAMPGLHVPAASVAVVGAVAAAVTEVVRFASKFTTKAKAK